MSSQLIKPTLTENIIRLPDVLKRIIFYYIPLDIFLKDETKLIKNIIGVYNIDYDVDLTRRLGCYYIKNNMDFQEYVFWCLFSYKDQKKNGFLYYGPEFGCREFDTLILKPFIKFKIEKQYKKLY
jgi:hypothetical protein